MSIQTFQKSEVQIESRKKELAKRESDRVVRHFKHLRGIKEISGSCLVDVHTFGLLALKLGTYIGTNYTVHVGVFGCMYKMEFIKH